MGGWFPQVSMASPIAFFAMGAGNQTLSNEGFFCCLSAYKLVIVEGMGK
jgi:hypothetical protein